MEHINRYIEHTVLKPDVTLKDIESAVKEALHYRFAGICVPPYWIKIAKKAIGEEDVLLIAPIGCPLGYSVTDIKLAEINKAIGDGADELDMVWNISAFKSNPGWAKEEIEKCVSAVHDANRILKIILETCYLDNEEIIEACTICSNSGVDFVKTSTGFGPAGARVEDITLMRKVLPSHIGIKASGGIRDFASAVSMIQAGADRIGTSSGSKIMKEAMQTL